MDDAQIEALRKLAEDATPGPWEACGEDRGGCVCGQVWSRAADCPVAKTERGEWGDSYPALKVTQGDGLHNTEIKIEAYREFMAYGALPDGQGEKNALFIGAFNPKACLDLLADLSEARRQLAEAKEKIGSAFWVGHDYGRLWGKKAISREEIERCSREIGLLLSTLEQDEDSKPRADESNELLSAAQRDLEEARGIANELFAYMRALRDPKVRTYFEAFRLGDWSAVGAAYKRIRPSVRKEIER